MAVAEDADTVGVLVRLRRDQKAWLDSQMIRTSEFIRKLLDEEIARREGKAQSKDPPLVLTIGSKEG